MSCTEGDEVGSPSAERGRSGARVGGFGRPPVKELVRGRARCAVGNEKGKRSKDTPWRGGAVGTAVARSDRG